MKLIEHLATKANTLELGEAEFSTMHKKQGGEVTHLGFVISAAYAGDDAKKKKRKYELVFDPAEFEKIRQQMNAMAERFQSEGLPEHTVEE